MTSSSSQVLYFELLRLLMSYEQSRRSSSEDTRATPLSSAACRCYLHTWYLLDSPFSSRLAVSKKPVVSGLFLSRYGLRFGLWPAVTLKSANKRQYTLSGRRGGAGREARRQSWSRTAGQAQIAPTVPDRWGAAANGSLNVARIRARSLAGPTPRQNQRSRR